MSLAWSAYRVVAPLIGAAAPAARAFAPKAERPLWAERMGRVAADGPVDAWIHAASLGETLAVGPLVRELSAAAPERRFHLTASTAGGRERLAGVGHPYSLAPLDAPQAVARFVSGVRPRRLLLIETELWPHWLLEARRTGFPVAVVSARLAARSVPRYRRLGGAFRGLVSELAGVLAQTADDATRWRTIGAPEARTVVVGNLKDDALPAPVADRSAERARLGLDPGRPLLVLGSLRPGEARIVAGAWRRTDPAVRAQWQVVAVARHPHAASTLRGEAEAEGQALVREGAPTGGAWRWEERLGVLSEYYGAADLALVGGTLGPYGGHNPLEPAARGAAVLLGPHHAAQADAVAALVEAGAARVAGEARSSADALAAALAGALAPWLVDGAARQAAAAAGLAVVARRRGAARRAVDRLAGWGLWPAA